MLLWRMTPAPRSFDRGAESTSGPKGRKINRQVFVLHLASTCLFLMLVIERIPLCNRTSSRNEIELIHTAQAAHRYGVTDRVAALAASAALRDFGLPSKENSSLFIDHHKRAYPGFF